MKKFIKILLLVVIFAFAYFSIGNFTYADENNVVATSNQATGQITTTVKTASSSENELLSTTNIINILLIAVGIVLILLSIAIFTRLSRK